MTKLTRQLIVGTAATLAVIGIAGATLSTSVAAGGTNNSNGNSDDPIYCEINTSETGNMVVLESMIYSDSAINGQFRFKVKSASGSGNTNISQGSMFSAGPGAPVMVGKTMLSRGNVYDASLTVTVAGVTFTCAERIGGSL
ncbi:MAG: curli-like amyloid fiber formation chaperone CsgH [Hyphomicrobiales bacterium]